MIARLEINRAVGLILLSRLWQFVSGFFSVLFLSSCLDENTQGLYQVFISLVAMQSFVSLGLPGIASLLTSHEWSRLEFGSGWRIIGDPSSRERLSGLDQWMSRWFLTGAGIFLVFVTMKGWNDIGAGDAPSGWQPAWVCYVLLNALSLPFLPKLSILEGCHQVATINMFRLYQAVTGTIVVWSVLLAGGGLWALVASTGIRWGWEFYLVQVRYRGAFESLRMTNTTAQTTIGHEVWPLAWRVAIQTVGAYFSSYYFTLVVHKTQGSIEAGRFGMTWGILMTMQSAAQSWVDTRLPEYGVLASRGEHRKLRAMLCRTGVISVVVFLGGAGGFVSLIGGLQLADMKIANRFLDLPTTGVMIAGLSLLLISSILQCSVRLYKRDPFLISNVIVSCLIGFLSWQAGHTSGSFAVGLVYTGTIGLVSLPASLILAVHNHRQQVSQDRSSFPANRGHG